MIGIIMAVAAVLEIHIDMNMVTKKSPRLSLKKVNIIVKNLLINIIQNLIELTVCDCIQLF